MQAFSARVPEASVTITLGPTDHAICTWVNTAASLTIVQDTVPDDAQDFAFTGCSGDCGAPVLLDDDPASATPGSVSAAGIAPGTYTVTQDPVPGWELLTLSCDTGESVDLALARATVVVDPGEQVTCTWVNRRPPPPNDDFADAQVLTGTSGTVTGTTVGAGNDLEPPAGCHAIDGGGMSPEMAFRWTAPADGEGLTQFPVTVADGRLDVDLNADARDTDDVDATTTTTEG